METQRFLPAIVSTILSGLYHCRWAFFKKTRFYHGEPYFFEGVPFRKVGRPDCRRNVFQAVIRCLSYLFNVKCGTMEEVDLVIKLREATWSMAKKKHIMALKGLELLPIGGNRKKSGGKGRALISADSVFEVTAIMLKRPLLIFKLDGMRELQLVEVFNADGTAGSIGKQVTYLADHSAVCLLQTENGLQGLARVAD